MVWPPQINHRMSSMPRLIAVAIDRDKGSQISLKWAVENLVAKGQTLILIHVKAKQSSPFLAPSASLPQPRPNQISDMDENGSANVESDARTKELLLPFHVYCARKDISCYDVVLEDTDVTKAITEFVKQSGIDVLVLGATVKGSIFRFKAKDIPGSVLKGVPDFCTIYIIQWKGKISSMRAASRPPPSILSPLHAQIMLHVCSQSNTSEPSLFSSNNSKNSFSEQSKTGSEPSPNAMQNEAHFMKSPFTHRMGPNGKPYDLSPQDTDISFVSSGMKGTDIVSRRKSIDIASGRKSIDIISGRKSMDMFPSYFEFESGHTPSRLSGLSDIENHAFESWQLGRKSVGTIPLEFSYASLENDRTSTSQSMVRSSLLRIHKSFTGHKLPGNTVL